ncbi:MAG: TIGR01906 family membrane protein [Chloroflexota bacterium]
MNIENTLEQTIFQWTVSILTPIVLLLTVTRLLMTPLFLNIEYRMPNYPVDAYGFTQADRIKLAPLALGYLFNNAGPEFLGDQLDENGNPYYNERELSHMVDVKVLAKIAIKVWYGLLGLMLVLGLMANRYNFISTFQQGLAVGGKTTMFLLAGLLIFIAINFNQVFITFHAIFFEGDSWIFLFSDTLIRLFPMRFWQDTFIALGGLTFAGGYLLWRYFSYK